MSKLSNGDVVIVGGPENVIGTVTFKKKSTGESGTES